MKPKHRDLTRLKRQIEKLDAKIDQGAERVLDAPAEIVPSLYRKLEELKSERDGLSTELESLARHNAKANGNGKDGDEIDLAINELQNLSNALKRAKPEDTRELLASIVTKIELFYEHDEKDNGRKTSTFSHGIVYLRPDAGEVRSSAPNSTMMSKSRP